MGQLGIAGLKIIFTAMAPDTSLNQPLHLVGLIQNPHLLHILKTFGFFLRKKLEHHTPGHIQPVLRNRIRIHLLEPLPTITVVCKENIHQKLY